MTSIYRQSKIISSRYFIDTVNQFRCNFIIIFMLNYLKNLYVCHHLLYLSVGKPK